MTNRSDDSSRKNSIMGQREPDPGRSTHIERGKSTEPDSKVDNAKPTKK